MNQESNNNGFNGYQGNNGFINNNQNGSGITSEITTNYNVSMDSYIKAQKARVPYYSYESYEKYINPNKATNKYQFLRLDEFRNTMLNDNRISHLVDYFDSTECFPGVDISGGVCYFLWNKDYHGDCIIESRRGHNITTLKRPLLEEGNDSFVRFNEAINIWHKIKNKSFISFVNYVSSRKPFGDFYDIKETQTKNNVLIYAYPRNGYVENNQILQNKEWVGKYKVFIAKAYGERGEFPYLVLGKPSAPIM